MSNLLHRKSDAEYADKTVERLHNLEMMKFAPFKHFAEDVLKRKPRLKIRIPGKKEASLRKSTNAEDAAISAAEKKVAAASGEKSGKKAPRRRKPTVVYDCYLRT